MKKQVILILLLCLVKITLAQPPAGKAKPGSSYGATTDAQNAIAASEVPALLSHRDTVPVKVKAKVISSCASKGCWMTLKVNDSTEAFVKMKDYAFFVPTDIQGKTVVLSGISFVKTTTVEDQKHYAQDAKKTKKEIDAIVAPKKEIRFLADGILVTE